MMITLQVSNSAGSWYNASTDVNQFGIPFGFEPLPLKGFTYG
jgi:hypothetical protein